MKVLLLNPHSPQNAGDLALLQTGIKQIREAFPGSEIVFTINDPHPIEFLPVDVPFIMSLIHCKTQLIVNVERRWRKWLMISLLCWLLIVSLLYRWFGIRFSPKNNDYRILLQHHYDANITISIGGGYLYSTKAFDLNFFWVWLGTALPIFMGKPLFLMPQSFGPVIGRVQCHMVQWLVDRTCWVAAREPESITFLQAIGVKKSILLLPDTAFIADEVEYDHMAQIVAPFLPKQNGKRPIIGMTLMDFGAQNQIFMKQQDYEQAILILIQHINRQYNAVIVLFAQCFGATPPEDDRIIARRIATQIDSSVSLCVVDAMLTPSVLKAAYRSLDVLVATRLHSAIFAFDTHTPSLVIGYLHKSLGLMNMLDMSDYQIDIGAVDSDMLCKKFDMLWQQRELISNHLEHRIHELHNDLDTLPRLMREAAGACL